MHVVLTNKETGKYFERIVMVKKNNYCISEHMHQEVDKQQYIRLGCCCWNNINWQYSKSDNKTSTSFTLTQLCWLGIGKSVLFQPSKVPSKYILLSQQ